MERLILVSLGSAGLAVFATFVVFACVIGAAWLAVPILAAAGFWWWIFRPLVRSIIDSAFNEAYPNTVEISGQELGFGYEGIHQAIPNSARLTVSRGLMRTLVIHDRLFARALVIPQSAIDRAALESLLIRERTLVVSAPTESPPKPH